MSAQIHINDRLAAQQLLTMRGLPQTNENFMAALQAMQQNPELKLSTPIGQEEAALAQNLQGGRDAQPVPYDKSVNQIPIGAQTSAPGADAQTFPLEDAPIDVAQLLGAPGAQSQGQGQIQAPMAAAPGVAPTSAPTPALPPGARPGGIHPSQFPGAPSLEEVLLTPDPSAAPDAVPSVPADVPTPPPSVAAPAPTAVPTPAASGVNPSILTGGPGAALADVLTRAGTSEQSPESSPIPMDTLLGGLGAAGAGAAAAELRRQSTPPPGTPFGGEVYPEFAVRNEPVVEEASESPRQPRPRRAAAQSVTPPTVPQTPAAQSVAPTAPATTPPPAPAESADIGNIVTETPTSTAAVAETDVPSTGRRRITDPTTGQAVVNLSVISDGDNFGRVLQRRLDREFGAGSYLVDANPRTGFAHITGGQLENPVVVTDLEQFLDPQTQAELRSVGPREQPQATPDGLRVDQEEAIRGGVVEKQAAEAQLRALRSQRNAPSEAAPTPPPAPAVATTTPLPEEAPITPEELQPATDARSRAANIAEQLQDVQSRGGSPVTVKQSAKGSKLSIDNVWYDLTDPSDIKALESRMAEFENRTKVDTSGLRNALRALVR